MNILREIFKDVNERDSPYRDIYYLTDTEIRFSIKDDRIARILNYSVRKEDDKYMAYAFERSQISRINSNIRQGIKEINSSEEFWKWFSNFYNDLS